ncbi:SpoIIE family protein phosphatase [Streptomyces sp. NPDC006872]|uniref:SpoIIE family protein phosphatase n=1 Tax=Streptomyces sp. NPDC006872 TaxID=3155720 RepID=UPI0033F635DA
MDTTRTAQELAEVGTDHLADLVTVDLLDVALHDEGTHPDDGPAVVRRIAQSASDGSTDRTEPVDVPGPRHIYPEGSEPAVALATGQPLRLGIEVSDAPTWLEMPADDSDPSDAGGIHSMLLVPLWARGNPLGLAQFCRRHTADPFEDDDLLLAQEIASRAAVNIILADIDLTPDELLTHLDDVVIRLQRTEQRAMGEISATCLYAVYDPVSRVCSLAGAGHVLPAVVTPGDAPAPHTVVFPDLPIGPPLGLGALPLNRLWTAVP